MGTSPENTLTSFDLDLLLGSASASLSENTNHVYQIQNEASTNSYQVNNLATDDNHQMDSWNGIIDHTYQTQNVENELSYSSHGEEMVKKSDYDILENNLRKLNTDHLSLQNDYQSKSKDYDVLRKHYAKLAADYASLHKENKEHAMASLHVSDKYERMEKKEVEYLATIKTLTARCEKYDIDIYAQSKQFIQYQSHVEDLMAQISTLKNNVKAEINNGKDSRKMISTLTSNNGTFKDHLCLFACIIEGRKQLDKESRRLIKKYCKKSSSSKKSIETENFENQSVDTGRGSSLAYSDGERSFYSPSFTFSPFSTGNVTPRHEPTRMIKDASTSPLQVPVTSDVPSSLMNFEKVIKTADVATNTLINHEDKSTMATVDTRNVATTPITFDEDPEANIQSIDIDNSPVRFEDRNILSAKAITINTTSPVRFEDIATKTITLSTATRPISFENTNETARVNTLSTATSPVRFEEKSIVASRTMLNRGTSPVRFEDIATKRITLSVATSPISFENTNVPAVINTLSTATSPVRFEDKNIVASRIMLNRGTSPVRFEDKNKVASKIMLNRGTSPVRFEDIATKAITLSVATSPISFENTNVTAGINTLSTATSPVRFEDKNVLNRGSSPVRFEDIATKIITLSIATSPITFENTNEAASVKTVNTSTSPISFENINEDFVKTNEAASQRQARTLYKTISPLRSEEINVASKAKIKEKGFVDTIVKNNTITMDTVNNPVCSTESMTVKLHSATKLELTQSVTNTKTTFATSPDQLHTSKPSGKTRKAHASSVKSSLVETMVHTERNGIVNNLKSSQNRGQIQKVVTKTSIACHVSKISEKLKEVTSKQSNDHDTENDLEIKMILSKHKLKWDILSPLSLSPEVTENRQTQSKDKEKNNKEADVQFLTQSLYLSEDDLSDNEMDREESHTSNFSIVNPPQEANTNVLFDLIKSQDSINKTDSIKFNKLGENTIYESHKDKSNKNRADTNKTRVSSTKGKKLTNLQKIYKANIHNRIRNIDDLPVNRNELDSKSELISPTKNSVSKSSAVSQNQEKRPKIPKKSIEKLQHNRDEAMEIRKENRKYSDKEPLQLPKDVEKANPRDPLLSQTEVSPETDISKRVNLKNKLLKSANDSSQTLESHQLKVFNNTSTDAQENPLINSVSDKYTVNPLESVHKKVLNCDPEHPKSIDKSKPNKKVCSTKDVQANNIVFPHTKTHPLPVACAKKRSVTETHMSQTKDDVNTNTQDSEITKGSECDTSNTGVIDDVEYSNPKSTHKRISRVKTDVKNLKAYLSNNETKDNVNTNIQDSEVKKTDEQLTKVSECETSITGVIDDVDYSKPTHKRISRVKTDSKTTKTFLSNTQSEITTNNNTICNTFDNKLKRPANAIDDGLDRKRKKKSRSQQIRPESDTMEENMVLDEPFSNIIENTNNKNSDILNISHVDEPKSTSNNVLCIAKSPSYQSRSFADYNDIALFEISHRSKKYSSYENWTSNILDRMVYKYGSRPAPMKTLSSKNDEAIALQIKTGIDRCVKLMSKPEEYTKTAQQLVSDLQKMGKQKIVTGMIKYLNDPARKSEFLFSNGGKFEKALTSPTATETEMALIDVMELFDKTGIVPWDLFLDSLEFTLFTLERGATPGFDVIESLSHLYANICRYRMNVSRIWMFMLNAMYCLTFKAIPIIKNCLDVVPEVLPYSSTHLGPGLAPLIRCLVFLLNFYSCDDPFKRVDAIRRILKYKYYYNLQNENETTLLFLLKQSIMNLTDNKLQKDMLELSFLIVAKRKGTKWCHKHLVQKIILPIIKGETEVSHRAKQFCITTIGHLMKPYNNEMTVHTEEVVNMLINMFEQESQSHEMKEVIIRGLLNMNMSTLSIRINTCLFNWNPPSVSSELEEALQMYVSRKNMKSWHSIYKNYYKELV